MNKLEVFFNTEEALFNHLRSGIDKSKTKNKLRLVDMLAPFVYVKDNHILPKVGTHPRLWVPRSLFEIFEPYMGEQTSLPIFRVLYRLTRGEFLTKHCYKSNCGERDCINPWHIIEGKKEKADQSFAQTIEVKRKREKRLKWSNYKGVVYFSSADFWRLDSLGLFSWSTISKWPLFEGYLVKIDKSLPNSAGRMNITPCRGQK